MIYALLFFIVKQFIVLQDFSEVQRNRDFVKKLEEQFAKNQKSISLEEIERLDSLGLNFSPEESLNIANIAVEVNTETANRYYNAALRSKTFSIKEKAFSGLAHIQLIEKDTAKAIDILHLALLENSNGAILAHNYEWLKKQYKGSPPPPKSPNISTSTSNSSKSDVVRDENSTDELKNTTDIPDIQQALLLLESLQEKEVYFVPRKRRNDRTTYGSW